MGRSAYPAKATSQTQTGVHSVTRLRLHLYLQLCGSMGSIHSAESLDKPTLLSLPDDLFIAITSQLCDRDLCMMELANTRVYHALLPSSCVWPYERTLDMAQFRKRLATQGTFRLALSLPKKWVELIVAGSHRRLVGCV